MARAFGHVKEMTMRTRILAVVCALMLALLPFQLAAHPEGHDDLEPVSQEQIHTAAQFIVEQLVAAKRVPASWGNLQPAEMAPRVFKDNPEWLIRYHNPEIQNPAEQNLYVFLNLGGQYLGAGYERDE
jgi:hypothetical protein